MFLRIYSDKGWSRYFMRKTRKQYDRSIGKIVRYPNGIIANEHVRGYGVFDSNFNFIKDSAQMRGRNFQLVPKKIDTNNVQYIDKDVVYLGGILQHFGDFLINNLVRTYCLLDKKYSKYCVVLVNDKNLNVIPKYVYTFLKLLRVPRNKIIILNDTARFKNVYIPNQGWNLPIWSSEQCANTFDAMAKNVGKIKLKKYEKIYFSRDCLKIRRTYGEKYVSEIFKKNGFSIICPEKLSLQKQIYLVRHCKILAGCAGSALHLALFMKPGGTVVQIKRNGLKKDNSAIQYLINKIKRLNSVFISGSIEKRLTLHCTSTPQIIGLNKYLRQFLDENGFVYDKNACDIDVKTLNEYNKDLAGYNDLHDNFLIDVFKRKFVKISACFIPGRENRSRYRKRIKSLLKIT